MHNQSLTANAYLGCQRTYPSSLAWHLTKLGVAGILWSAAYSKLSNVVPGESTTFTSIPWVKAMLMQGEFLLGAWLISGIGVSYAATVSIIVFSVFASYNLLLASSGVLSCSCFGSRQTPPLVMMCIDIAVAGLVWFVSPKSLALSRRTIRTVVVGLLILAGGLLAGFPIAVHSAMYRGKPIALNAESLSVGRVNKANPFCATVDLANTSSSPIALIGCSSRCTCDIEIDFPYTVAPGEVARIPIKFPAGMSPGRFRYYLKFFTDHPAMPYVPLAVFGEVE